MVSKIAPEALIELLDEPETLNLIDVRTPEEFSAWAIPAARNVPLDEIASRLDDIGPSPVVVMCAAGVRAQQAAEILEEHGFDALVADGGMQAWGNAYDSASMTFGPVTVVQLRRRGKGCLSYVIGAGSSCLVIDPSVHTEQFTAVARDHGWKIDAVADTHLHADHVSGAVLLAETTGAALILNDKDGYAFTPANVFDGTELHLGAGASITIDRLSTPGHTQGSTTFALGNEALFTGDTLFLESVGRPDLADKAEEFAASLYDSLHETVLSYPEPTFVFPAHVGQGVPIHSGEVVTATLGELKATLPALSLDREKFIAWAASQATLRPPNYVTIVETNRDGTRLTLDEISSLESGPNRCAVSAPVSIDA